MARRKNQSKFYLYLCLIGIVFRTFRLCSKLDSSHHMAEALGMQLLASFEDQVEGEAAEKKVVGKKRLASERDSNLIVWNLFGDATWVNFYNLGMFDLVELKQIVEQRKAGQAFDSARHAEILETLSSVESMYGLAIPSHWK